MLIQHITLLTGHTATHRLDTLAPEAIQACRSLLPGGGQVPGFPAFRVEIHGPMFTIWRGREPIVTACVGFGQSPEWEIMADMQARFGPVKVPRAPAGNWLAVVLLPPLVNQAESDIGWLGDFERCLAAAILGVNS